MAAPASLAKQAGSSKTYGADLLRLGTGAAFNGLGMTGEQVVVGLLMFQIGGSSVWVGLSLALYFAPMLLCGPVAGALADTVDRRRLMAVVEAVQAAVLLGLGALIACGIASLPLLLAMTLLSGTVRTFHHPAKLGYAFDLAGADRVVSTLGRLNVVTRLGQLAGGLLGGWVGGQVSLEAAVFIVAAGHLVGSLVLIQLRTPGRARHARRESVRETLSDYVAELKSNVSLRLLMAVVCTAEIFGYAYMTLLPELATVRLGFGPEGLGLLQALRGVGGLASGLLLSRTVHQAHNGIKYLLTVCGFGIALVALALVDGTASVLALVTLVAAFAAAGDVFAQSLMQLCVPDRLRGRAMGIWVLALGTGPVGHLQMGALAGAAGLALTLSLNGVVLLLVGGGALLLSSRLRQL